MLDKEKLFEILDLIYDYNNSVTINDIKEELNLSDYDLDKALSVLYYYNIIGFEDDYIIPKMKYEMVEVLIDQIDL